MNKRTGSECPPALATLMDLCNALPPPLTWPPGYEEASAGGDIDWTAAEQSLEAQLIHPEVLAAEIHHSFNAEFACDYDSEFAEEFGKDFWGAAIRFRVVTDRAERLFGRFLLKHGPRVRRQMDASLEPFMRVAHVAQNPALDEDEVSFTSLLTDRIKRFNLSDKLISFLNGDILPPTHSADCEKGDTRSQNQWYELWRACGSLGSIALMDLEPNRRGKSDQELEIYKDDDGIVRVRTQQDLFINIVTAHDIPAERVRMCRECGDYFWAKRLDSVCCSKRCLNAYRVRIFRAKKRAQEQQKTKTA